MKMEFIQDPDNISWGTLIVEHASITIEFRCLKKMAIIYTQKIIENPNGSIEAIEHFVKWIDNVELSVDAKKI